MSICKNGYRRHRFGQSLVMICQKHGKAMIRPVDKKKFRQIAPQVGEVMNYLISENAGTEVSVNVSKKVKKVVPDAIRATAFVNPGETAWAEIIMPKKER